MQYLNQAQACYSDYDVVELSPISDSLIIEVQTEELPQDFFEGFFEEVEQISTLPEDFFEGFFEELEQISTLPEDFFSEFFEELELISTQHEKELVQATEKVRKRVSEPTTTNSPTLIGNETRAFLYNPHSNVYEEWRKKFTDHFKFKLQKFLPSESAEDVVSEFLAWLVKKDKLKGHTEFIEKKFNWVKSVMFKQFVTQRRQKSAKCALYRHGDINARTEQEVTHLKAGVTLKNHIQIDTANVVYAKNDETGRMEDTGDLYYSEESEVEDEVEKREVHEIVFNAFASSTQTQEEAQRLYDVFVELAERNYRTEAQWAENWGVEVKELKKLKYKVKNTIKKSKILREMYS